MGRRRKRRRREIFSSRCPFPQKPQNASNSSSLCPRMISTKRKEKERKHKSLPHKLSDLSFSPTFFCRQCPCHRCSTKSLVSIPHFPDDLRILPDISAKPRLPPPLSLLLPPAKNVASPSPSLRSTPALQLPKDLECIPPSPPKGKPVPPSSFSIPTLPSRQRANGISKAKALPPPLLFPSFLSAHKPIRGGGENPSRRRFALFHICA